jgi:N-acyl homoserine lactone hydrolase
VRDSRRVGVRPLDARPTSHPRVEVLPLQLASITFPEWHPLTGEGDVLGFALRHRGGVVLFDTGIGDGSDVIDRLYRPVRRSIDEALADHDHRRSDVTAIVNSHLHFDHCGNNSLFPGVPIYAQEVELVAARQPRYTVPEWVAFEGAEYRSIDGDAEVAPGIRVVSTPGHTEGHQSIVVDDGDRPVVLAGQAIYSRAELVDMTGDGPTDEATSIGEDESNPAQYRASARRLMALRPRRVHFSHDREVWERTD